MTAKEFIQNTDARAELAATLNSKVFKDASEAVFFESIPHPDNLGRVNDSAGNAILQQLAGMKQFVRMLEALAEGKAGPKKLSEPRLYTEADKEDLKKQTDQ